LHRPVRSYPAHLRDLADQRPDEPAVTETSASGDRASVTRAELQQRVDDLAVDLRARGVGEGDMVSVALPNGIDWIVATMAAWRLGAIPQPVNHRLPVSELEAVVELADSKVVLGVDPSVLPERTCLPAGYQPPARPADTELPDAVSPSWKAPTSGGSTGRPKLIVAGDPAVVDPTFSMAEMFGMTPDGCIVMPGPLHHNGPLVWTTAGLLSGMHVVLFDRFDPTATLRAIEEHGADSIYMVPTMMRRIWKLPEDVRQSFDLSSLKVLWHLAEPCPAWLKEAWIEWIGPERIMELYGGTEGQASAVISGTEWLEHRGSVGKPLGGEVTIRDPEGNEVPAGEEGEVWLRTTREKPPYHYVGAEARTLPGGWESLGDMGHVDEDGYLYLGDRSSDMVLVGGANVYPAEIEAVLDQHDDVRSCAVIGLPDDDVGNRLHAIVEGDAETLSIDELMAFAAERLAPYKRPRTIEVVGEPLRDDAGKVRRSQLRAERLGSTTS
jgi:bile acid-coenzyme A ligase